MSFRLKIDDKVKRNTTGYLGNEVGVVVEIDDSSERARVKWSDKRTWFKISNLVIVKN